MEKALIRRGDNPLASALLDALRTGLSQWRTMRAADLGVTPFFSYVVLENGAVGLAYNPGERCRLCMDEAYEHTVESLASMAWRGLGETSLALAAFSAATQSWIDEDPGRIEMPAPPLRSVVPHAQQSLALLVGFMRGIREELEASGYRVVVLEDDPRLRAEAGEALPGGYLHLFRPDVLVATGASLLDPRLHAYMARMEGVWAALLGPSATIYPPAAWRLGYVCVGGSYVPRSARGAVARMLKLGASYHELRRKRLIRKWMKCKRRSGDHRV